MRNLKIQFYIHCWRSFIESRLEPVNQNALRKEGGRLFSFYLWESSHKQIGSSRKPDDKSLPVYCNTVTRPKILCKCVTQHTTLKAHPLVALFSKTAPVIFRPHIHVIPTNDHEQRIGTSQKGHQGRGPHDLGMPGFTDFCGCVECCGMFLVVVLSCDSWHNQCLHLTILFCICDDYVSFL